MATPSTPRPSRTRSHSTSCRSGGTSGWARSASRRRGCRSRICAARARRRRVRNWPRPAAPATIRRVRRLLTSFVCLALAAGAVSARSEKTLAYPRDAVWPTAVRFLVVDEHVKVIEKDAEAGYVLFEIKDDGKVFRGSLEVL